MQRQNIESVNFYVFFSVLILDMIPATSEQTQQKMGTFDFFQNNSLKLWD